MDHICILPDSANKSHTTAPRQDCLQEAATPVPTPELLQYRPGRLEPRLTAPPPGSETAKGRTDLKNMHNDDTHKTLSAGGDPPRRQKDHLLLAALKKKKEWRRTFPSHKMTSLARASIVRRIAT